MNEEDKFCDANCVWTDHHPDCTKGKPKIDEVLHKAVLSSAKIIHQPQRHLMQQAKEQYPAETISDELIFDVLGSIDYNPKHHKTLLTKSQIIELGKKMYGLGAKVHTPPPQSQQEFVEWGVDWGKDGNQSCVSIIKRLANGGIEVVAIEYNPTPSPIAQREWVGLTDEERQDVYADYEMILGDRWDYERAIEAKLKEKNA
jgi:hypothetical protein